MQPQVLLITASQMPKPDPETNLLVKWLDEINITSRVVAWDDPTVRWEKSQLSIIRTTWDYFRRLPEFLNWVSEVQHKTLLWNPAAMIVWNSHKRYMLDLATKGVPIVPTQLVEQDASIDLNEMLAQESWSEIIIKPAVSVGAIGAGRFKQGDGEAQSHLKRLLQSDDALLQRYIPEIETEGELSLIFLDGQFSHAVRKRAKAGEYRVQDHHGGSSEPYIPSTGDLKVAQAALDALDTTPAYARVDLVPTSGEPLLMELELIEPELFFRQSEQGTQAFARQIAHRVQ